MNSRRPTVTSPQRVFFVAALGGALLAFVEFWILVWVLSAVSDPNVLALLGVGVWLAAAQAGIAARRLGAKAAWAAAGIAALLYLVATVFVLGTLFRNADSLR